MGRKRIWPPKVHQHKGRDRVWWMDDWHDLGPAGSAEARAKFGRLVALWAADPTAAVRRADELLVPDLCRDYLASSAAPTDPRQLGQAGRAVGLLAEHHLVTPVAEFGPVELAAWQRWLCALPDAADGTRFNVTTVNHLVGVVKRVWRWGVASGRVGAERWQALLAVPRPRPGEARPGRVVEPADPADVRKTAPFLRPPVRAMILLQWHTGARPEELCGLKAGDVVRAGLLHLPGVGRVDLDAENVWVVPLFKHKTARKGKPRWLTFAGDAQLILLPFLAREPAAFCFSPKEAMADLRAEQRAGREARGGGSGGSRKKPRPAATRPLGDRYSPGTYRQAVARACERAGVPHWFPYQLRHLTAAEVKAAFDVDGVGAVLGHHTRTMAEHYGGRSFKKAAEIARQRGGGPDGGKPAD